MQIMTDISIHFFTITTWKGKYQSMDNTKNRKKKEEILTKKNEEISGRKAHKHREA